jgi:hypothetical protein
LNVLTAVGHYGKQKFVARRNVVLSVHEAGVLRDSCRMLLGLVLLAAGVFKATCVQKGCLVF